MVDPVPEVYRERLDYFGNRVSYFEIRERHLRTFERMHLLAQVG